MSTLQRNPRVSPPARPTIVAAIGVIIAVAAGAYALTSNHANHPQPIITHTHTPSPQLPPIQAPSTAQAHIVLSARTGQAHGTVAPPTNPTNVTLNSQDKSNVGHRADA